MQFRNYFFLLFILSISITLFDNASELKGDAKLNFDFGLWQQELTRSMNKEQLDDLKVLVAKSIKIFDILGDMKEIFEKHHGLILQIFINLLKYNKFSDQDLMLFFGQAVKYAVNFEKVKTLYFSNKINMPSSIIKYYEVNNALLEEIIKESNS